MPEVPVEAPMPEGENIASSGIQDGPALEDESPDWAHLYQYRRHHDMRNCFVRTTNYGNEVGAIANTWDVNRDDVLQVHLMRINPIGIPARAQAVIVQLWGDDHPYSVLLDLVSHAPFNYRLIAVLETHRCSTDS